jgi:chemotaxis protein methyltransferase CheR
MPASGTPDDVLTWICAELMYRFGVDATDRNKRKIGSVVAALADRMAWAWRLSNLPSDSREWLDLAEILTVHETYFLRDPRQFDFLRQTALKEIIERRRAVAAPGLRLWSAACSTGEEAYSLAFVALESLIEADEAKYADNGEFHFRRPWHIEIVGSDLSETALSTAKAGIYPRLGIGATRSLPQRYWQFFDRGEAVDGNWTVRRTQRDLVRFMQLNLLNGVAPPGAFDIVFCRNILIYLDASAKDAVYRLVHRALGGDGYAAFGRGEVPTVPGLFQPRWGDMTVIYRPMGART